VGSNETFMASSTRGALLSTFVAGADVATDVGTNAENYDTTASADPVSYTCSAGSDTAIFDIIIEYVEIVSDVN